jgi:hypothetical protein
VCQDPNIIILCGLESAWIIFLAHKISIYMYITKWEKEKEKGKGFSALVGRGGGRIPAQHGPRARDGVMVTGPRARESGRGDDISADGEGG